jgi:hypothetical protein
MKNHTQFVHKPPACTFQPHTEPAKVSWEGTQLEVACGKEFCKAASRIKNADLVTSDRPGVETDGWGSLQTSDFAGANGDPAFGVALLALADDGERGGMGERGLTCAPSNLSRHL